MTRILMCVPKGAGAAATQFEMKIFDAAGDHIACVCRDGEALERELRKPWASYGLLILFVGTDSDLELFASFQELLEDMPLLLVLPDSRGDICKRAHLLRPRFLAFADDDFSDFIAVLQKMILNQESSGTVQMHKGCADSQTETPEPCH